MHVRQGLISDPQAQYHPPAWTRSFPASYAASTSCHQV